MLNEYLDKLMQRIDLTRVEAEEVAEERVRVHAHGDAREAGGDEGGHDFLFR